MTSLCHSVHSFQLVLAFFSRFSKQTVKNPKLRTAVVAAQCRVRQASADRSISNWMGMRILMRSSLFKRLTLW